MPLYHFYFQEQKRVVEIHLHLGFDEKSPIEKKKKFRKSSDLTTVGYSRGIITKNDFVQILGVNQILPTRGSPFLSEFFSVPYRFVL
jgi:hypothetical protein